MLRSSQPSFNHPGRMGRMGLWTLTVFIILALLLVPSAQAAPGKITGSVVNIRSGPGSGYDVVGTLLIDTKVEVLQSGADWSKIRYSNIEGYVASQYISTGQTVTPPAVPNTPAKQVKVINGPINSRSGPNASYDKVEILPDQAVYNVIGQKDGWYQIQLSGGKTAFVAGWLVQEIGSSSPAPAPQPPTPAPPAGTGSHAVSSVLFNNQPLKFEVPPRIENGRTLVPLRTIFEAMGAYVEWNESTRTVIARRGSTTVILPLGSTSPTVNGQTWQLEVPAKIVNDRTLAPLRFVGEAFGGKVAWNEQTRVVTIAYTPAPTPAVVAVKEGAVNLRENPSTTAARAGVANAGERLNVLSEKNGWYQVSQGGRTAWVASWVVEPAAGNAPEPVPVEPVIPPVVEPTPQPPAPPAPVPDPENALRLSRSRDASGIKVVISSNQNLEPQIQESSGSIRYAFTDRPLLGLNYFEEKMGSELLKVKASDYDKDTQITISLPSEVEYKTMVEDGGKKLVLYIPNYLINIEKSPFGSVGERFVISTLCPVTPTGKVSGDRLEVTLPGLNLKKGINYNYSSDLVKSLQVEKNANNLLMTFDIQGQYKHSFAVSGSNNDLNIILMRKTTNQNREKLVVLDAGHGGKDPGACGTLIKEKEVTLPVTLKVGELLKQKGIPVEYTRTDDRFVELNEISNIANRLNATLFVSIHCNSSTSPDPSGTETYFYAPLTTPELYVQRDERQKLATLLQNELMSKLQRINRGVKEKNLAVLRNAQMPSALVELAFISNPAEQALLMQDDFQNLAAQAIANAIEQYMREM